jgi:hypothetical protein
MASNDVNPVEQEETERTELKPRMEGNKLQPTNVQDPEKLQIPIKMVPGT